MTSAVLEDGVDWTFDMCAAVIDAAAPVTLAETTRAKMLASFEHFSNKTLHEQIYGLNTGLGPIVTTRIERSELIEQQYQLILSHAAGMGPTLPERFSRAATLARAKSMSAGLSAIRPDLPALLCLWLNRNVAPVIPRHGGVGASGDLVQLAHLGLGMIGRGHLFHDGQKRLATDVFDRVLETKPLELMLRDGLSICNGTSCMTGIAIANVIDATKLLNHALDIAAALAAVTQTGDEPFSERLNQAKRHSGQQRVASEIRERKARFLMDGSVTKLRPLQEHYSIRCTPQILGTIEQTLTNVAALVLDEFNSASDNPIFDLDTDKIFHGGNFHGEPVAVAMDQLKASIVKMTMLFERQLNFLLNDEVNKIFPPFLNGGKIGVDFGLQGAQFTAVSTTSHSQSLAFPMHVHSIPSNKDNQDIVSMGTDAALMTSEVIENAFTVLAILSVAVDRAMSLAGVDGPREPETALGIAAELRVPDRLTAPIGEILDLVRGSLKTSPSPALGLIR